MKRNNFGIPGECCWQTRRVREGKEGAAGRAVIACTLKQITMADSVKANEVAQNTPGLASFRVELANTETTR